MLHSMPETPLFPCFCVPEQVARGRRVLAGLGSPAVGYTDRIFAHAPEKCWGNEDPVVPRTYPMLTYKAAYQFVDGGVHAHLVDFPGAITCGADLAEARRLLASALLDLVDLCLERGEALPVPNPSQTDPDAHIEEPLHLHLRASATIEPVNPAPP